MLSLISQDVPFRGEPTFAWKSVVATYQAIPCLRVVYPMSGQDGDGDCLDFSGNGLTLNNNGDLKYDHRDLAPIVDLDGTGDYLSRADHAALDVTGTESFVQAAFRGLSCGLWVESDGNASGAGLLSKFLDSTNQRSYLISINGSGQYESNISRAGTAATSVMVTVPTAHVQGAWTFLALRFDPGDELKMWVNRDTYTTATAEASVHSGSAPFYLGRRDTGVATLDFDGRLALAWVAAANLPDYIISSLFEYSRAMFNV